MPLPGSCADGDCGTCRYCEGSSLNHAMAIGKGEYEMEEGELIRKVLDLASVDVFECHGDLALFTPCVNPIKVRGACSPGVIGFAMVDGDRGRVQIFLVKACPERLDIENGVPYYIVTGYELGLLEVGIMLVPLTHYAVGGKTPPLVTKGSF